MKKFFSTSALFVFSLVLLFSKSSSANESSTLVGKCDFSNGVRYEIYYTDRVSRGNHIVQVEAYVDDEHMTQEWVAMGWDKVDDEDAFVISRTFGLALVDGDTNSNTLFAPGMPSEKLHCVNNLTPFLKDFPK